MSENSTREKILSICKGLLQSKGYSSFSLEQVAELAETSRTNVYHHFQSKEDLVKETVIKYKNDFSDILDEIEAQNLSLRESLQSLIDTYAKVLEPDNRKICLCICLLPEFNNLSESIQQELRNFFDLQVNWVLKISQNVSPEITLSNDEAAMIIGSFEGIVTVARIKGGSEYFKSVTSSLVENLLLAHQN
ncbi:TetR/AcrR family transcriptional regulator [Gloeothece verrucosa]|uniref:Transcriptional regulator, TetR family n=1 Tax=Gloeothece verrucosa (strain PCC 7822) TaxID=497965 RepID=E0U7U6_GLOV7|nr:TetR/AcrR family transcriptional regulator [Gloeothece verrucosa]ADN16033.1 transcriptional regulator, TetR family [Gloeothece verrucosa PCC 7822]